MLFNRYVQPYFPQTIFKSLIIGAFLFSCPAHAEKIVSDKNEKRKVAATHEYIEVVGIRQPRRLDQTGTSGQYITGEQLRQAQVRDTNDLGRVLPGLQIENTGNFLFPAITSRGITSAQDPYHPATTFYIDDVPVLPINAMQSLISVDSVQFLRGPQATLYGQSAEGGVIDIKTRQPDSHQHVSFEAGAESRYGYHVSGSADGSLIKDWLYGSIAVSSQDQQGNIKNPTTGSHRLGGFSSHGGRATLRLAPTGQPWEFNFSADGACSYGSQDVYVNFDSLRSRNIASAGSKTPDPRLRRCGYNESLHFIYHFNGWKMSAIGSWQNSNIHRSFPYYSYISNQPEDWSANNQEIRFSTEGMHHFYDLVTGFFHQTTSQERTSQLSIYTPYTLYPLTASHNRLETVAIYSNAYLHILKNFDLGLGGRLSRDMSHIIFDSTYAGQTLFSGNKSRSQNMMLGNISLDYEALPGWHIHGRISQGYKSAGFNYAPTSIADATSYNPEREISYEIGTVYRKKTFFARAGYFYNHIKNEQLYVGPLGYQIIANAGRAYSTGVEGEFHWEFLPKWIIGADGNKTISKFNQFSDGAGNNYAGLHMPYVPKFMVAGHLSTKFQTQFGQIEPGVDIRVTGSQYFDIANQLKQPTYTQLDFRATWSLKSRYEVTVYIKNATDKLYRTYAFTGPSGNVAQINFGRTVGFNLKVAIGNN